MPRYNPICESCNARPKMDGCGICEECWYGSSAEQIARERNEGLLQREDGAAWPWMVLNLNDYLAS